MLICFIKLIIYFRQHKITVVKVNQERFLRPFIISNRLSDPKYMNHKC